MSSRLASIVQPPVPLPFTKGHRRPRHPALACSPKPHSSKECKPSRQIPKLPRRHTGGPRSARPHPHPRDRPPCISGCRPSDRQPLRCVICILPWRPLWAGSPSPPLVLALSLLLAQGTPRLSQQVFGATVQGTRGNVPGGWKSLDGLKATAVVALVGLDCGTVAWTFRC